jgi:hypothetical protein
VLQMGGTSLRSGDFGFLKELKALRIYSSGGDEFADADVSVLSQMRIRNVTLLSKAVTARSLEHFTSMHSLAVLTLRAEAFNEDQQQIVRAKLPKTLIVFKPSPK